jgi:class 3 adenylate cyclase
LLVAESVELATILLTDLVGSTRLATSVGPVRADQLREEHFELLRDAIASSGGREVKNTGDGLMVAFSSASAAVQCAVAMQQLFERRYRDAEQALHVRIGLAAGESTVKDGDYFGTPSIEAARLCAQAPSDGVLISGMAKALAGRCEGVEFFSAGELDLKGFPDPVEAFSVSWAPLAEETSEPSGRWPLPALLRSVPPVKYVGRVEERAALEEAIKLARAGQRQVVLLSGEPGIGKTRLSSYAARDAHAEGFAVVWGACTEELAVPYEPWIAVCAQLVESAPVELLGRHVERHKGELARLARNLEGRVPDLAAPQSSDPETERFLLFNAVAGLLGEVAEMLPLCVVLDDLHWADAQSLALLKHLLRSSEQGSLQVIVTYRDSDLGKDHPLTGVLADLRSLQGVQRIALHGLGANEVAEIMTAVAGHELPAGGIELAGQIAAETDGNPFFVGEILLGLSESGALVFNEDTQRWSIDTSSGIALPESVREVIERRVERLDPQATELLKQAAVIGRVFNVELLSACSDLAEGPLLDHLESAVAASLLTESTERVGEFSFVHALIDQTLYDGMGATRRARMHLRVAEALEELYGANPDEHLAELALHWRLAAVSVDKAKAADYALKAGQRALESLAPAEALKLFADAVELGGDANSRARCEALIGLGGAQLQTGSAEYRETLLEASRIACALEDAELAARAALANNRGYSSVIGDVDGERLSAIERALTLDDPPHPGRRARLVALQAAELLWHPDFARRWALADEAVSMARETGDARTRAEVLRWACDAYSSARNVERRTALHEELLSCAAAAGDPALEFWAHQQGVYIYVECGSLARARAVLERTNQIAEDLGQPTMKWFAAFTAAAFDLLCGDLAAAERIAELAFAIGRDAGQQDAALIYGAQLVFIRVYQGRGHEVLAMLENVRAYPAIVAWRAGLASDLCWLNRREEAEEILKQAARDRFEHVLPGQSELTALLLYADAAVQTNDVDAAAILRDLIKPWSDQVDFNGVMTCGYARMWLGLLAAVLGENDQADRDLAIACDFQEKNELWLMAARGHLGWAEVLATCGDVARAQEHAARALELSRAHGYGTFESRAAAILEAQPAAEA